MDAAVHARYELNCLAPPSRVPLFGLPLSLEHVHELMFGVHMAHVQTT
jgi:hypothetical protein